MKKIIVSLLALTFICNINLMAQKQDPLLLKISDKAGDKTFLKDFPFEIKAGSESRYVINLSKKTSYTMYINIPSPNTLDIRLYDSNNNILYNNKSTDTGIIKFSIKCNKSQNYHLVIKNNSRQLISSTAVLYFEGKYELEKDEFTMPKLNDLIGVSNGTYLKDFQVDLNPESESRYSLVLSNNSIYEILYFQENQGRFTIDLYADKKSKQILPTSHNINENTESQLFTIKETGVYHLIVKNTSKQSGQTIILLSFVDKISDNEINHVYASENDEKQEETVYFQVDKMPKFDKQLTKANSFEEFITLNLNYPQDALKKQIEGKVYVQFTVSKEGYVKDAKVTRGVHPSLDQEALRIIYSSPKWEPGIKDKEAVDVILTFPVTFKLQ